MSFSSQESSITRKPVSSKLDLSIHSLFLLFLRGKKLQLSCTTLLPGLSPSGRSTVEWTLAQMGSSECNALVGVNGHCLLLPLSDHRLRAETRRELLSAPPWVPGVGLRGKSRVS